jgi:hypothetical protein
VAAHDGKFLSIKRFQCDKIASEFCNFSTVQNNSAITEIQWHWHLSAVGYNSTFRQIHSHQSFSTVANNSNLREIRWHGHFPILADNSAIRKGLSDWNFSCIRFIYSIICPYMYSTSDSIQACWFSTITTLAGIASIPKLVNC